MVQRIVRNGNAFGVKCFPDHRGFDAGDFELVVVLQHADGLGKRAAVNIVDGDCCFADTACKLDIAVLIKVCYFRIGVCVFLKVRAVSEICIEGQRLECRDTEGIAALGLAVFEFLDLIADQHDVCCLHMEIQLNRLGICRFSARCLTYGGFEFDANPNFRGRNLGQIRTLRVEVFRIGQSRLVVEIVSRQVQTGNLLCLHLAAAGILILIRDGINILSGYQLRNRVLTVFHSDCSRLFVGAVSHERGASSLCLFAFLPAGILDMNIRVQLRKLLNLDRV